MKRLFLLSLLLAMFCFTAVAHAAVPLNKIGIGTGINGVATPHLKYYFNKDFAGILGASYTSAATTTTTIILGGERLMTSQKNLNTFIGGMVGIVSGATSTTTLGIYCGAELFMFPNVSVEGRILPFTTTSGGATTITTFNSGAELIIRYYL